MNRTFFLALLPFLAYANWDQFFSGSDNPAIAHHVNVITGHLNLSFQDVVAQGALSIPLLRTYSSAGALESDYNQFLTSYFRGGWVLQGGWSLLAHTTVIIIPSYDPKDYKAYLAEPNGGVIAYKYSHKEKGAKHVFFLKPKSSSNRASGQISARANSHNSLLRIDLKKGKADLFLPDGGHRNYKGQPLHHHATSNIKTYFYLLTSEILPSHHQLIYFYDAERNLQKIEAQNPDGNKIYSSIQFELVRGDKQNPFQLIAKTSDKKELTYQIGRYGKCEYLHAMHSNFRPAEKDHLARERKGLGARLTSFDLEGKEQFKVRYYPPPKNSRPDKKYSYIDKVQSLHAPVGPQGEEIEVAHFTYGRHKTSIRDVNQLLTEYHHDGEKLAKILYFNEKDQLLSMQAFFWDGSHLYRKAMFDDQGQILFSKVFSYEGDNVKEEVLTENAGEESYRKTYSYYADNLVKTEQEENGLNYEYFYKPNTDLLIAKFTKDQEGHVLIREFRFYDEDNLLVHEITDNGVSIEPNDIRNVTQRLQKYTERDAASGLPITITESYWDPISGVQKLLKRTKFTYINHKVSTEAVFDAQDVHRYTIETEYDHFGNVKRQTTPLGQENTYLYNDLCNLAQVKEVGSSSKIYEYDRANRQVSCLEVDTGKTVRNTYSAKSLILSETDERGNITVHSYDLLGNRRSTTFPKAIDENGLIYEPTMTFGYDVQGNLTSSTTPRNETTQTFYNALRKPIRIIQADGSEIRHFYDRNGALSKTMHPDETEEHYGYDLFQRMTSKIIYNSTHEVLSHESWSYDAFQLRSYTDPRGLVTKFSYDGAGRKISEEAEDRTIIYAYDSLGFLERTNNGAIISVQKHNAAGLIEEQWTEDASGRIENRMQFSYNSENQKIKAIRFTSQGEARDLFTYADGKLVSHTDPLRAVTKFIYDESFINRLGQNVLRKMTIDPLNNQTIETYDAGGRLVCKEKKDPQGLTVSKEERFYDRSGNCAKRLSYVYVEGAISKQIEVRWEYDAIGRVTKEMEAGKKTTLFYYDKRGFLSARILPSGVRISSVYDGIGRLLEEYSSDGTMNNQYIYANSPDPIQIIDHVQKTMIKRSYNRFGDLIKEVNMNDFQMRWQYDSIGRCISMILPDASSIDYAYLGAHLRAVQRKSTYGHLLYEHQYNQFDPNGHVAEEQLIFGLGSIVTTHDLLERPSNQCSSWLEHSIGYGPSGLVTATYNSLFGKKTYQHDALNQLIMEGEQTYCFDSLGNPAAYEINDLNQIVATQDCRLVHDENGNLYEKVYAHKHVRYSFDSCSRLSKITVPKQKKIIYSYDPLSRLSSKEIYQYSEDVWTQESKIFYLYNQEQEIGTLDENGKLIELKVLGLGIKGDIGAAIAIELGNQVYAPLHNFSGNVIALLSSDGQVAESYEIDAFGKETSSSTPLNPWRFCSKRSEEGFVFFGLRFYDPSLGRWLSPDPSGFSDGPNLYAYVQNSPLNRLDLFGLFSEDPFQMPEIQFNIPILSLANSQLLQCKVLEGGVYTDYIVSCGHWHQLSFTPHELESGSCNLLDHPELGGADGRISLVTYRHGINTTYSEFSDTCTSIVQRFPGTLFIGRYHGTEGLVKDSVNTAKEFCNIETVEICKTLQWELSCSQFVQKINPVVFNSSGEVQSGDLWMHLTHSRGGLIDFKALQNMPYEQKRILQYQLLLTAIAPAHLIPRNFGLEVMNIYSSQDFFTGPLGMPEVLAPLFGITGHLIAKYAFDRSDYNIKIVPCVSKWGERSFGVADHAILGGTYREVISNSIDSNKKIYGFYDGKTR